MVWWIKTERVKLWSQLNCYSSPNPVGTDRKVRVNCCHKLTTCRINRITFLLSHFRPNTPAFHSFVTLCRTMCMKSFFSRVISILSADLSECPPIFTTRTLWNCVTESGTSSRMPKTYWWFLKVFIKEPSTNEQKTNR